MPSVYHVLPYFEGYLVGSFGNVLHDVVEGMLGFEGASWNDYILVNFRN